MRAEAAAELSMTPNYQPCKICLTLMDVAFLILSGWIDLFV